MKTPDEIKKGLHKCGENTWCDGPDCPYYEIPECHTYIARDALAYIQKLERERDAAIADLAENRRCETCKYYTPGYFCIGCRHGDQWQWRGVQEVER